LLFAAFPSLIIFSCKKKTAIFNCYKSKYTAKQGSSKQCFQIARLIAINRD